MAVDTNAPFLWGSGGRRLTPEEILLERKEANALGQQAMATTPVGHWSAGLNRVLQGLMSGYDDSVATAASNKNAAESSSVIQALMAQAGGASAAAPITAPAASGVAPVSTPMGNTSIPVSQDDNAARAMAFFQSKGLSPADSAAMVWNFQQESGKGLNPTLSHDGGTGFGIAGFRDPAPGQGRWTNLRNFAAENKLDPNSIDAQLQFSWNELQGPENATLQKIQAAQTPEQKAAAAIGYFRPRADYAAQRASRVGEVNSLLGRQQPVQVASNDPSFAPAAPIGPNDASPLDTAQYPAGPVGAPVDGVDPAALPATAQAAQGTLPTAQAVQAATQPARPAINPIVVQALTNRYISDDAKRMAGLLFKSQLDQQAKASDPAHQLDIQLKQGQLSALPLDRRAKELANTKAERDLQGEGATPLSAEERASIGIPPGQPAYKTRSGEIKFGPAGTKITTNVGADETAFDKEAGKVQANRFNDLIGEGQQAKQMVSDIATLTDLGKSINTGKGAQVRGALGPFADAVGIKIDGLSDIQAFNSIVNRMAPALRVKGSGSQSDTELRNFMMSLPSLGNTPEGNEIIGTVMNGLQQNKIAAAEIGSKALNKEITRSEAEKQLRDLPDPMGPYREYRKRQGKTVQGAPSSNVDELLKKYGN